MKFVQHVIFGFCFFPSPLTSVYVLLSRRWSLFSRPKRASVKKTWVRTAFSDVRNTAPPAIPDYGPAPAFGASELGRKVTVIPLREVRRLALSWPLPPQKKHRRSKPTRYVSHLLVLFPFRSRFLVFACGSHPPEAKILVAIVHFPYSTAIIRGWKIL